MAFSEFTLEDVTRLLGITTQEADLFSDAAPAVVPEWLPGWLARGTRLALLSEKARSEFIVVPILMAGASCVATASLSSRDSGLTLIRKRD